MKLKYGPLAQNFLLSLRPIYLTAYSTPLFGENKLKMTQPGSLPQFLIMVNSTAIHLVNWASQKPGTQLDISPLSLHTSQSPLSSIPFPGHSSRSSYYHLSSPRTFIIGVLTSTPLFPHTIFQNVASNLKVRRNLIMTLTRLQSNSTVYQMANSWPLPTVLASHGSPLSSYQPHCLSLTSVTLFCPFPSHNPIGLESLHHLNDPSSTVHSNSPPQGIFPDSINWVWSPEQTVTPSLLHHQSTQHTGWLAVWHLSPPR